MAEGPNVRATDASVRVRHDVRVGRQRPLGAREELFPARRVTVLDDGEPLEEIASRGISLHLCQLAIEKGRVTLVRIVLVPARIGLGLVGGHGSG